MRLRPLVALTAFGALLSVVAAGVGWPSLPPAQASTPAQSADELVEVEVATVGVDLMTATPIALLRDAAWSRVVPIWIGEAEAMAIARSLQGVEPPRPMTHDLMVSAIGGMGGVLEEVQVTGVQGSTYLGRIVIRLDDGNGSRLVEVDSRPSDALALAVRTGAKVRVAASILDAENDVDFVAMEGVAEVVRILGVTVGPITPALRRDHALPPRPGVVVLHSSRGDSPELLRGDLVLDVNGEVPETARDFLRALRLGDPAVPARLVILREGEESLVELPRGGLDGRPTGPRRET